MELDAYQARAETTAIYPMQKSAIGLAYAALGLAGEAGEIANKVKKVMRDDNFVLTADRRRQLKAELGDVLWYVAQVATELGVELGQVAEENIAKLETRKQAGTLQGSGDGR